MQIPNGPKHTIIILIRQNEARSRESPDGTGKRVPRMHVSPSFLRVIKDAWDCKRWAPVLADEPANVSTEIFMMIVYGPYVY